MTWRFCSKHVLCEGPAPGEERCIYCYEYVPGDADGASCIYCTDDEYNGTADALASLHEGYRHIRERVAAGGLSWMPRGPKGGA